MKAHIKGPPPHEGGNIQERVVMVDHIKIEDPLNEGGIKVKMGGHQTKEDTSMEDTLEEGTQIKMEGPLEEEAP